MVRFTTAALICGIFVILGAIISGTGTSLTLGKLGAVNALGGSLMAALAGWNRLLDDKVWPSSFYKSSNHRFNNWMESI